jgi:putative molybdopterin biosynthesis protein
VAYQYDLGFIPVQDEHYDFVVPLSRAHRSAVQRFRALLHEPSLRTALLADGFGLSPPGLHRRAWNEAKVRMPK